ncbi:MAG TPA: hypothetical protein VK436_12790 [Methanocella sp.]|nr:hypothetical protein [Methanocella sp.]
MDGAGTTIFDRIEQKLTAAGAVIDITNLKEAIGQYDAKIAENPNDLDSKLIGLELKLVLLARLLNTAVDMLPQNSISQATDHTGKPTSATTAQAPRPKKKRLRQNPDTGVIEETDDTDTGEVIIVADGRGNFKGRVSGGNKTDKKCVFIAATDDEPVRTSEKKR